MLNDKTVEERFQRVTLFRFKLVPKINAILQKILEASEKNIFIIIIIHVCFLLFHISVHLF